MKTMISMDGKRVWRTTNEKASELYSGGEANYAPKSEWKEEVRDIDKEVHENPVGVGFAQKDMKKKSNKMSRSTKLHMRKANK